MRVVTTSLVIDFLAQVKANTIHNFGRLVCTNYIALPSFLLGTFAEQLSTSKNYVVCGLNLEPKIKKIQVKTENTLFELHFYM